MLKSFSRRLIRGYATDASHKYSKTLSLPKTSFPNRSNQSKNEEYLRITTDELYKNQLDLFKQNEKFILHDGPPYANGDLHLGHAINKILKDFINRINLLNKKQILYIPGFDCHGLPIELKALKGKSSDLTTKLSPIEVRGKARKLALETIKKQVSSFKKFAIMGDWENCYKTLDKQFEVKELRIFQKMFAKKMIKRQKKPVYWGCETGTALAEGELEYNEHISIAAYLKFPLIKTNDKFEEILSKNNINNVKALIWTSTPWTIVANKAICINEKFEYTLIKKNDEYLIVLKELSDNLIKLNPEYSQTNISIPGSILINNYYKNPLINQALSFPVIHGSHVTNSAGTGLVHTAPGHGQDDYLVGLNNSLEIYSPVDNKGCYNNELLPGFEELVGLKVLGKGTQKILELFESQKISFFIDNHYLHSYPYDWRSKKPIIIRSTPQWFADLSQIKKDALNALEDVRFIPEKGYNRLSSFIKNRNEWCISRQRSWGVPIPVFYHKETHEPLISEEIIEHTIKQIEIKGTDAWFENDVESWLPSGYKSKANEYYKGLDTIDVWFDSGSSWTLIEEELYKSNELDERNFIADVYLEGSDQHRGWFQSSLLTKIASNGLIETDTKAPYSTIITHGFTLDNKGQKMSKSIGNTINPIDVIEGNQKLQIPKLGIDGLRLWVASSDYTSDLTISPVILNHVGDNLKKIRFTFKYLLGNLGDFKEDKDFKLTNIDKYILVKLNNLIKSVKKNEENYQFNKTIQELNYFMNNELSATYFNIIKDELYANNKSSNHIKFVLQQILNGYLYILSPILPIITQEVCQHRGNQHNPLLNDYKFDYAIENQENVESLFSHLWKFKENVLKIMELARQKDKILKNSLECCLFIDAPILQELMIKADCSLSELSDILLVSQVKFGKPENFEYCYDGSYKDEKFYIVNSEQFKCPRCWKFNSLKEEELCERCEDVLSN